ncbi:phosphoenolpyruvate carboxylase [Candidatus Peregrinibacteria bacterium]|jgi:phosphoenolpyruvate carboxylase|nr:phosphoenolpyruvate carboxylase [Candidatus Peregrinibacteria bacterium]MBT4147653.1 phosphoenolpyruvate carboxylase [Candidatus Peregrinibacteria bacterium]MBT4366291.1 phosphoenolpyruvate carboxylase [Candidatus Peregrinibacteria bacterium]MBT4456257.1 phosphoenolpyruvate carboxylase [Candidatus Peregrinibacteria bacterium]
MFNSQSDRKIPILMGTQHPDNAGVPFWSDDAFINTKQEAEEIYRSFFEVGCDEYMWDWEGKFADEAMIEKLLSEYFDEFKKTQIGRDQFVTLRIPNVWEEKTFKLARAYMSVLSAGEFVKSLGLHVPPVFELILPMTKTADQLLHIQDTFRRTARVHEEIFDEDRFGDGYVHIIPLFESVDDLTGAAGVLREFLEVHKERWGFLPPYLRVFIARSDPALNAGFVPAMLATRMALREFYRIGEEFGIPVYPIVGTGSLPFRGGINPENIKHSLKQYEGVKTITIQSAFRYDYPLEQVRDALSFIRETCENVSPVRFSDEEFSGLREVNSVFKDFYSGTINKFAPLINDMAKFVPSRRERVQHVGLFGYSRGVGDVTLPRAIKFTAACYSLGVPPEFIGTGRGLKAARDAGQLDLIKNHFFTLVWELIHAGKFLNMENLEMFAREGESWAQDVLEDVRLCEEVLGVEFKPQKDHHYLHRNVTSNIVLKKKIGEDFQDDLLEAAKLRKSLG